MSMNNIISFSMGMLFGGAISYYYVKKKFNDGYQEEIKNIKETLKKEKENKVDKHIENDIMDTEAIYDNLKSSGETEEELTKYNDVVEKTNYNRLYETEDEDEDENENNDDSKLKVVENENPIAKPYVISPDEFEQNYDDDYITITFIYFADGVLTEDDYTIVDNIEETIGSESLNHFGEYEDDSVYVKNECRKRYYEILLDDRNYYDIV